MLGTNMAPVSLSPSLLPVTGLPVAPRRRRRRRLFALRDWTLRLERQPHHLPTHSLAPTPHPHPMGFAVFQFGPSPSSSSLMHLMCFDDGVNALLLVVGAFFGER